LAELEVRAQRDKDLCLKEFVDWMVSVAGPDAKYFNPQSGTQMQTLFFGGAENSKKKGEFLPRERVVKVELAPEEVAELEEYERAVAAHKERAVARASEQRAQAKAQGPQDALFFAPQGGGGGVGLGAGAEGPEGGRAGAPTTSAAGAEGLTWSMLGLPTGSTAGALEASLKAVELKDLCRRCGLRVSGTKAELAKRVAGAVQESALSPAATASGEGEGAGEATDGGGHTSESPTSESPTSVSLDPYAGLSVEALRNALRARNLDDSALATRAALLRELRSIFDRFFPRTICDFVVGFL
jgi:hypothetical protein